MSNTIKLKRGSSTPTTSDIVDGEVAIDKSAQKLYINDGGSIKEIGGGSGGGGSSTTINNNANNRVITGSDTSNTLEGEPSLTYDGAGNLTLSSSDTGSTANPILALDRNSSSPADDDVLGDIHFKGRNSAGEEVTYGSFMTKIDDASNGTEDGRLIYKTMKNGALTTVLDIKADQLKVNNVSEVLFGDPVSSIKFEGATGDAYETTVQVTDPTADRTVTIPNKSGTFMLDVADDSSPQLGGDLDMNSNFISSGILGIKNQGAQSEMRLYCESNNAHYAGIKAPAHADFSGNLSFTLPSGYGSNGQVLQSNGSGGTSWVSQTTAYTNSSVDSHLNTSSASSGQILSWNGSDYAWVADQTGGGGGGGISNLVEDTTPQLGGNLDMQTNNISGTGTVIANSTAVATAGMRKIHASTSAPSGSDGAVGDIWVKY